MEREMLKQRLSAAFRLTVNQVKERSGHGYTLHMKAAWPVNEFDVRSFRVQLVGVDPLTGRDVERDEIVAKFSFDQKQHITLPMTYHGSFRLRCAAVLEHGEVLEFKQQEIDLDYPANKPWIVYRCAPQNGFMQVTLKSNCWNNYRGRLWARFDGHDQRINLPAAADGTLSFVLPTSSEPELRVPGETGIIRKG